MDGGEKFNNKHSEYLQNIMENVVVEEVRAMVAKDGNICTCEKCIYDISAIVLNNIKPRYITTDKGGLFARIEQSGFAEKTQIKVEVARAIEIVKNKKSH